VEKGGAILMDKQKIAKRLIELRGDRSQKEVAIAVGIGKSAISMYEMGERIPRDEIKIKIADFYNKSVEDIFFN
jgi:DNA-binding XRE family transcriptional regulator